MTVLAQNGVESRTGAGNQFPPDAIVFGRSEQMQPVRDRFGKIASSDVPVLLEGESGTGKDLLARMLHERSPWSSGVFVRVRCCSIQDIFDGVLEADLAAELSGAFRDAPSGCYGTLFLDEISETNASLQTKLLRLLQEGQFCSVYLTGSKLKLRVVCAANRGLEEATDRGSFRRDLLYRINVLTFRVPPLRERTADIPDLVRYFLDLFSSAYNCEVKYPSRAMLQAMISYSWPGNIRELENLMRRYVLFDSQEAVCDELLARAKKQVSPQLSQPGSVSLKELARNAVREVERDAILKVLEANQWNRKRAACVLNISYRALLYKLKDAGVAAVTPLGGRLAARPQVINRTAL